MACARLTLRGAGAASCAAFVLLASLTGCTVPLVGVTGVSVDQAGRLILVVAWCGDDPPDGVQVYTENRDGHTRDIPRFTATGLDGHISSFRPESPGPDWTVSAGVDAFHRGTTYLAYGFTHDDTGSTAHVAFELGSTASLTPSTVLVAVPDSDQPGNDVVGRGQFEDLACEVSQ